jgi:hypothetical protein
MTGRPPGPGPGAPPAGAGPLHALMQAPPGRRTTVQVQLYQDPWPLIAGWAQHHKLTQLGPPLDGLVVFSRAVGQQHVAILVQGTILTLQTWISIPMIMRLRSLFILPAELPTASGGLRATIARKRLRAAVNELLGHLQAPPIP